MLTARILGWFFDQVMRRPLARFAEANARPFAAQEEALRRILRENAATEEGARLAFARLAARTGNDLWSAFRKEVPLRAYEEFLPAIERMKAGEENILVPGRPEMFSLTSGTTSAPKFCPVTAAFIKEHHRQHLLWMYHVYKHRPAVNGGKYLVIASPAEMGRTEGGIPYGAMSGKQLAVQSIPVRRRQAAPVGAQSLPDAEERWFATLLFALGEERLRVVTAVNPSTLVALANRMERDADRLLEHVERGWAAAGVRFAANPGRARALRDIRRANGALTPAAVWPELEILLTWQGGASSFYLPHVKALWGDTAMRCLGLRASEGTFSIPLRDNDPSGVLAVGGHVLEFLPGGTEKVRPDARTLLPGELEKGGLYRLVVTTSGGLFRYDMGDLVRVTGFLGRTPEVAFERRAGAVLSATGEKVTEDQVVSAMAAAAASGPLLNGFTVTYEMTGAGAVGYVLAVECAGGSDLSGGTGKRLRGLLGQVLSAFDEALRNNNVEYGAKREDGRLLPPRMVLLPGGSYEGYRARLAAGGRPESQVKQPVLVFPPAPGRAPVPGCPFFDRVSIAAEIGW